MPTASMNLINTVTTTGTRSILGSSTPPDRIGPASANGSSTGITTSGQSFVAQLAAVLVETGPSPAASSQSLNGISASSAFTRADVSHDVVVTAQAQAAGMRKETQARQPESGNQVMQPASTASARTRNRPQVNNVALATMAVSSKDSSGIPTDTFPLIGRAIQDGRPALKHAVSRVAEGNSDDPMSNSTARITPVATADTTALTAIMITPDVKTTTLPKAPTPDTEPVASPAQPMSITGIEQAADPDAGSVSDNPHRDPRPATLLARTEPEADATWMTSGELVDAANVTQPVRAANASIVSGPDSDDVGAGRSLATMVATPIAQAGGTDGPTRTGAVSPAGVGTSRQGAASDSGRGSDDARLGMLGATATATDGINVAGAAQPDQAANLAISNPDTAQRGMSATTTVREPPETGITQRAATAWPNVANTATPHQAAALDSALGSSFIPGSTQSGVSTITVIQTASAAAPALSTPTAGINVPSRAELTRTAGFSFASSSDPGVVQSGMSVAAAPARAASTTGIDVAGATAHGQPAVLDTMSGSTPRAAAPGMSSAIVAQADSPALPNTPEAEAVIVTPPLKGMNASVSATSRVPSVPVAGNVSMVPPARLVAASSRIDKAVQIVSSIDVTENDTTIQINTLPPAPGSTIPAPAASAFINDAVSVDGVAQLDTSVTSATTAVPDGLAERDVASAPARQPMLDALHSHQPVPGLSGQPDIVHTSRLTGVADVSKTRSFAAASVVDRESSATVMDAGTPAPSSVQPALPVIDTKAEHPGVHDETVATPRPDIAPISQGTLPAAAASFVTPTIDPATIAIADTAGGQTGSAVQSQASVAPATMTGPAQALALPAFLSPDTADAPGASTQVAASLLTLGSSPDGSSQITVSLHPKDLGSVQVQVDRAADGAVRITVAASEPGTLRSLMTNQAHLHAALDAASVPNANRHLSFELAAPSVASTHAGNAPVIDRQPETPRIDGPASNQTGFDPSGSRNFDQQDRNRSQDDRPGSAPRGRSGFDETGDAGTAGRLRGTSTPSSLRPSAGSINITA